MKRKVLNHIIEIGRKRSDSKLPLKLSLGASKWIAMGEKPPRLVCRKRREDGSHGNLKGTTILMNPAFPSTTTGTCNLPPKTGVSYN